MIDHEVSVQQTGRFSHDYWHYGVPWLRRHLSARSWDAFLESRLADGLLGAEYRALLQRHLEDTVVDGWEHAHGMAGG